LKPSDARTILPNGEIFDRDGEGDHRAGMQVPAILGGSIRCVTTL
jgi:hypothetical protein